MITPSPPDPSTSDPIHALLRAAHADLVDDLRSQLDLTAGVEEATDPGPYQDLTHDLAHHLDVETGLVAITGVSTTLTRDQRRPLESVDNDGTGEDAGWGSDIAGKLGVAPGMVVQELGWDTDVDEAVRDAVEELCGDDLLDEGSGEVIDLVLLWWREGDGDLVDALMDAIGPLADNGVIWVLTPKTGQAGHVEPSEIAGVALAAGLSQTSNVSVGGRWAGTRLATWQAVKRQESTRRFTTGGETAC